MKASQTCLWTANVLLYGTEEFYDQNRDPRRVM
nr:unnamed protein product [Callosobruchus analis]CAI5849658.1 unnamed protein product [Callosobruchus analis]